jgi:biotin transporter BioY
MRKLLTEFVEKLVQKWIKINLSCFSSVLCGKLPKISAVYANIFYNLLYPFIISFLIYYLIGFKWMHSSANLDNKVKRVAVVELKVVKLISFWIMRQWLRRDKRQK